MKTICKRSLALFLVVCLVTSLVSVCAYDLPASYDETYYATLDHYGSLTEGSVVKSYRLNGQTSVTDYGSYDQVLNLTDSTAPTLAGSSVTFDLSDSTPSKFYFQANTAQPFEDLPWSISISYKLNGAPARAEDLAGKTGLVEIDIDVLPRATSSDYNRDNLVLTVATAFNDDDILSLSAPGAETQLLGNLRTVLFLTLPGEEQHFAIQVGSENFSFSGLVLLAVPATLQQLETVAQLKEAKETGEDTLDDIRSSLDTLLDSLSAMGGSLNSAASGLDRLNAARATVSAGKDAVYASSDQALSSLQGLSDSLAALDGNIPSLSQALTDLNASLNDLNDAAQSLSPQLASTRSTVSALQKDLAAFRDLLTDLEVHNAEATQLATSLSKETKDLSSEIDDLQEALEKLERSLRLTTGLSTLSDSDLLALLTPEEAAQMKEVLSLHKTYERYLKANSLTESDLSFEAFIVSAKTQEAYETAYQSAYAQYCAALTENGLPSDQLPSYETFLASDDPTISSLRASAKAQADSALAAAGLTDTAHAAAEAYASFAAQQPLVDTINSKIKEVNKTLTQITKPTAALVDELAYCCDLLGDSGVADDLHSLAALCAKVLTTLNDHSGEGAALLDDLDLAGDLLTRLTATADTALATLDSLNDTLNTYEPTLQSALTDLSGLSAATRSALTDTSSALSSAQDLLKTSGAQLDPGVDTSLSSLADVLRKTSRALDSTDSLRSANDSLSDLLDDQWEQHSGGVDGLLNLDAQAPCVSMTDARNAAPDSVQYVMRTQEIKPSKTSSEPESAVEETSSTFLSRVAGLFKGLWEDFKSLLHIG